MTTPAITFRTLYVHQPSLTHSRPSIKPEEVRKQSDRQIDRHLDKEATKDKTLKSNGHKRKSYSSYEAHSKYIKY